MTTFVLVHGAWHGGWCWQKVIPFLETADHEVYAPTLTGLAGTCVSGPGDWLRHSLGLPPLASQSSRDAASSREIEALEEVQNWRQVAH